MGSFFRSAPAAALLNLYGSTVRPTPPAPSSRSRRAPTTRSAGRRPTVPIGLSIDGCGFLVLEPSSRKSPRRRGHASAKDAEDATGGEIFVYGKNQANGYVNRPDLDAAACDAAADYDQAAAAAAAAAATTVRDRRRRRGADGDDDGEDGGGRRRRKLPAFRTGDFGYVQAADKALAVGRRDQQVKIRGHAWTVGGGGEFRGLPRVATAAVALLKKGGSGMEQIAAYVAGGVGTRQERAPFHPSTNRRCVCSYKVLHAVPSLMLPCTAPLPNGKLDRAALKRPLGQPRARLFPRGGAVRRGRGRGAEDGEERARNAARAGGDLARDGPSGVQRRRHGVLRRRWR